MYLDCSYSIQRFVGTASIAALLIACHGNFESDPCRGVTCSGHGVCLDNDDVAVCLCDPGYAPSASSLECVADGTDGDGDSDVDSDVDGDSDSDADVEPCVPSTEICNEVDDDCDGVVDEGFDLTRDPENCGSCGNICPVDPTNASSWCIPEGCVIECDFGSVNCNDDLDDGCETRLGTPDSCGGCDDPCPEDRPLCEYDPTLGYACVTDCVPPEIACSGSCVDISTNVAHCGECSGVCTAPPHASPTCSAGECGYVCDPDFGDCETTVDDGCETSLRSVDNCGRCGNFCEFEHATPICSDGECSIGSCDSGWGDCLPGGTDGCETPLDTVTNCGECDEPCDLEHADGSCETGVCTLMTCLPGFDNCDDDPETGCETDLTAVTDCGSCGNECGSEELCRDSSCVPCPWGCDCEQTCLTADSCVCSGGCPCDITCIGRCSIECTGHDTLCTLDMTEAENPLNVDCQNGATCIVDATRGDLGSDFRCEGPETVCEVGCFDAFDCSVECVLGASCLVTCLEASSCDFRRCDGSEEMCPDDVLVCNRPCP